MSQLIANIVRHGTKYDWYIFPLYAAIVAVALVVGFFIQRLDAIHRRDWSTVSAVIDVVSVVEQTEVTRYGERTIGYLATLTYFYRNPELQIGEYCQTFGSEEDARSWSESYKGRVVFIRVDPREASRSVLLKENL